MAPTRSLSSGSKNIAIGFNAGSNLSSGNNNIYIGNPGAGSEFQTIRIGTAHPLCQDDCMASSSLALYINFEGTDCLLTIPGQLRPDG